MLSLTDCLIPGWSAPAAVRALCTTRAGGVSGPPYGLCIDGVEKAGGLNLGDHVGDAPAHVARNRAALRARLPGDPLWLQQVHGTHVVEIDAACGAAQKVPVADACFTLLPDRPCVVMTADCLPVLFSSSDGRAVGAAHAGWRGLCSGVIEATAAAMRQALARDGHADTPLLAWLGPAIGPHAFEVGAEVRQAFVAAAGSGEGEATSACFVSNAPTDDRSRPRMARGSEKYLADLYALARLRLARCGIETAAGGKWCTYGDARRFYSYRRDGLTGRMASVIWIGRR